MMKKQEDYRLAAIMFTDIYGFSSKMEKDEKKTLYLLSLHNEIIEKLVKQYNGHVIKTIGDAFLVDFNNTVNAVQCATEIQQALHQFNEDKDGMDRLYVRIGIHLGDIWFFENDAFGDSINVASRLEGIARPGTICISDAVHAQIQNKLDITPVSLGKAHLKNISREIDAYEIGSVASEDFQNRKKTDEQQNKDSNQNNKTTDKPVDDEDIKNSILRNLKIADNRISLTGIQKLFNISEKKLNGMLSNLTESGLLVEIEKDNGEVEFSFGSFNKLFQSGSSPKTGKSYKELRRLAKERRKRRISGIPDFSKFKKITNIEEFKEIFPQKKKKNISRRIEKLLSKVNQIIHSFIPGLIFFPVIMFILFFINNLVTPGIPWFILPLVFGSIGIVNSFFNFLFSLSQRNIILDLPDKVSSKQYNALKSFFKNDKSFLGHVGSFSFFNMLFFLTNCLTNPAGFPLITGTTTFQNAIALSPIQSLLSSSFFISLSSLPPVWFIFPLAIWGAGLFFHLMITIPYRTRLINRIHSFNLLEEEPNDSEEIESSNKTKKDSTQNKKQQHVDTEFDHLLLESRRIKERISKRVASSDIIQQKLDKNIDQLLDEHIGHIEKLKTRATELEQYLETSLFKDVDDRIAELETKQEATQDSQLTNEYAKSIQQLQRHRNTYMELEKQRELLYLRFTQAVMSLKQLELDVTNLDEVINNDVETSIRLFEERARDLGSYVKNIKQSYRDIDNYLEP